MKDVDSRGLYRDRGPRLDLDVTRNLPMILAQIKKSDARKAAMAVCSSSKSSRDASMIMDMLGLRSQLTDDE